MISDVDSDGDSEHDDETHGTIASLFNGSRDHLLMLKGIVKGQEVMCMVDSGAAHNFLDEDFVVKEGLQIEDFSIFNVMLVDGSKISCTRRIPRLSIQLDDYTFDDKLYAVGIKGTKIVLGVPWLKSLGRHIQDFNNMEVEFTHEGKQIVLRATKSVNPQVVVAKCMQTYLDDERHELPNPEFPVEIVDHSHDVDSDLVDDSLSGPATQELSVMSSDGIHSSILSLSPISLDMTVISLLIGDFIFFDSLWTSGCPSWNHIALPDFILTT